MVQVWRLDVSTVKQAGQHQTVCCIVLTVTQIAQTEYSSLFTCDRNNVEQPPHGLWANVAEPVLSHQQLGQVEGHLSGDGPLHLPTPVCVLNRV